MPEYPDPSLFTSVVDIVDDAALRYPADRPTLSLRTDDGIDLAWSAAELRRRARLAAWRLRAAGLSPGDRLMTWSPPTPRVPAVFWGAAMGGIVLVPLDLRMAPAVLKRIADRAGTTHMALGTGPDAPDPDGAGLDGLVIHQLDELTADADVSFPTDWEAQLDAWSRPVRSDLYQIVYTSGTTSAPKGVMLTHGNMLSTVELCKALLPPRPLRVVSLLPLSHLFEQAPVLMYGTLIGAEVMYVRSRNPRVIFEALRELQVTTMIVTPQLMELFWSAITREVDKQGKRATFDRARRIARHLPYPARRLLFRSIHKQLGGEFSMFVSAGAYLPPEIQRSWEDLGVLVLQGYGATECGPAAANSERHHPAGVVGRPIPPIQLRLADDTSEIMVAGPSVSPGYWQDADATAAAFEPDGWYHTGDIGHFDANGDLVLSGRIKNIIVLPNGLNVFPEDVEAALHDHGISQSVVLETAPGRIEAVVLPPGTQPIIAPGRGGQEARDPEQEAAVRKDIEGIVKAVNGDLSIHQRIDAWRLWPEPDFPRTHTLKVRRDAIREWASADIPLQVRDDPSLLSEAPGGQPPGSASTPT